MSIVSKLNGASMKLYRLWNTEDKQYIGEYVDVSNVSITVPEGCELHSFNVTADPENYGRSGMLIGRNYYKPFDFPMAFNYWELHESIHWLPKEVSFENDVTDWNHRLTTNEREFLTQLFRFFTQADVDVNGAYAGIFLPKLRHVPELNMLCSSIAAREAVHVAAYSQLIDTVGMEESEYKVFREYKEMAEKHDYLQQFETETPYDMAKTFVVYNGFVEGMQLFSSFAMLLNFGRYGKMNGMIEIVSWSLRDESLHVEAMCSVYHEFRKQYRKYIDKRKLNAEVRDVAKRMVDLEDRFIDLAFSTGGVQGLDPELVKQYIRYTADYRLTQYGIRPLYGISENPLPWVDEIVSGKEHSNFFERRATEYGKANVKGSIDDINWADLSK